MSDHGMYALLDMHQDALWQHGKDNAQGGYWGVPPHIKEDLTLTQELEFPYPLEQEKTRFDSKCCMAEYTCSPLVS
jgi:hypothetical protein